MTHNDDDISVKMSNHYLTIMPVHLLLSRPGFFALKYMLYSRLCAVSSSKSSRIVTLRPVFSTTGGRGGIMLPFVKIG